jgi:sialidase-1
MPLRLILPAILLLTTLPARAADPVKLDLFQANTAGYETYRIPGVVVTRRGTILAYCEARKLARGDWGQIDLFLRRSTDNGQTFGAPRRIATPPPDAQRNPAAAAKNLGHEGGITLNNPVMIADPDTGVVHLLYCVEYARCFHARSDDDGQTFAPPVEITATFETLRPKYDWKVLATGPGHGLRLSKTGRLLVPAWLSTGTGGHAHRPSCVTTIYSDDAGKTWHAGDIVVDSSKTTPNPSESTAVELADGSVLLNIRNESRKRRRLVTTSKDGATAWATPTFDETLFDPICFASLIRPTGDTLVWSNPAGDGRSGARRDLTIRLSPDAGRTWSHAKLLEPGPAAYSDLALTPDG